MTKLDALGVALDLIFEAKTKGDKLLDNPMTRPLPPDPEAVGECDNPKCRAEFFPGDTVLEYDGERFCDAYCLAEALGAERVEITSEEALNRG